MVTFSAGTGSVADALRKARQVGVDSETLSRIKAATWIKRDGPDSYLLIPDAEWEELKAAIAAAQNGA